jgi:hypothetical protein
VIFVRENKYKKYLDCVLFLGLFSCVLFLGLLTLHVSNQKIKNPREKLTGPNYNLLERCSVSLKPPKKE